jgi:NAD kinase
LKFGIYVHSKRPKISPNEILKVVESTGVSYSNRDPDMAIVVGGDGTFGYYGKKVHIPMLFVGVNDNDVLGSKARLAELSFDDLHKALSEIKKGNYRLEKRTMFCVCIKHKNNDNKKEGRIERATDILTDVYIERGIFSRCIRYALTMRKANPGYHTLKKFVEYAIGNGVIVSTSFGACGYYSYLDRIRVGKRNNNKSNNGAQIRYLSHYTHIFSPKTEFRV